MAKIGAGHAAAMGRLGLKELRNALNPSRESVADSEIGLAGTATQGQIADAMGGPGRGPEQEGHGGPLTLDSLRKLANESAQAAEQGMDRGQQQEQERGPELGG